MSNEIEYIMEVDTLIKNVRALKGYIDESKQNEYVPVEKAYAACLYRGEENLGAFLIFERVRVCIRAYYYDDYEQGAVASTKSHHVPLAYEQHPVEKRVELFNTNAKQFYKESIEKGLKLPPPFEIRDLKPFKMKNATGKDIV